MQPSARMRPEKKEDGSSGACNLEAGGYCGNIFVWDVGRLLMDMPGIIHH